MIHSSEMQLVLTNPGQDEEVKLKPTAADTALKDARELVLLGRSYDSEAEAAKAAERWRGLIQKVFARVNLGADFGDRTPGGSWTKHGLKMLEEQSGRRVLNDVHGISVFECEPPPLFARAEAKPVKGVPRDRLMNAVAAAMELGAVMSDRDRLAYDLYSASFSDASADARFAVLMMSVETLIDLQPRSDVVRDHVDRLISETEASGLPQEEIKSIVGSLKWLHSESIGQAGRKLASLLGDRKYMDESPGRFFTNCYALRGRLFHGSYPRPPWMEVELRAGSLQLFVRDLLSIELLDKVD